MIVDGPRDAGDYEIMVIGYVPLLAAALLIVAAEMGFAAEEGLASRFTARPPGRRRGTG